MIYGDLLEEQEYPLMGLIGPHVLNMQEVRDTLVPWADLREQVYRGVHIVFATDPERALAWRETFVAVRHRDYSALVGEKHAKN